ncbi:hypothetical protein AWZ03_002790 [Drosophila navojoa]|uniref:Uncharacterized protein n=1 Tax=Drosophila navojoa TaxID=7232 RepID=A0A484BSQ9_DRONA|nr:signal transducer and activator of transcription C [Drosophila navojoa]TDG50801.1 hypothetical protein AWZ03_002790 [Drosophila navojoa]
MRCLVFCVLIAVGHAQLPNAPFQQTPFQQRQLQQQQQPQQPQPPPPPFQRQRQQPPGQGLFPVQANPLTPLSPLNPLTPNPYSRYNQYAQQNYVPITAYQNDLNLDGSFSYGYAAADGTTAQAQGYVKNLGYGEGVEAQVIQGSYSYTSPEGTPITVRYIADENGFRAEGTGIPATPSYFVGAQPYQQGVINPNLNPYQTPFRQLPTGAQGFRPGQQLTPQQQQLQQQQLQQQQQQQQRNFQNSGQFQPDQPFNSLLSGNLPAQYAGQFGQPLGGNLTPQQQQQQNLNQQQQQNLNQQQQQNLNQQQQQQKDPRNEQQQQALITQQLRGRPNQLVDPFGYNQFNRRFKKSSKQ